jgi:hypothetical protein
MVIFHFRRDLSPAQSNTFIGNPGYRRLSGSRRRPIDRVKQRLNGGTNI